jgi:mono/diheme cytochrome c family protein
MPSKLAPLFRRCCLAISLATGLVAPTFAAESPGLDVLMGGSGRSKLQAELAALVFDRGKTHSWQEYSNWGKEIFLAGRVRTPPAGSSPSTPVSKYFTCASCHNHEREDPVLPVLDAEARFDWIERTGAKIFLLQGVTMWGGVNRKTFYAGDFAKYRDLCLPQGEELLPWLPCGLGFGFCLPGCRTMDPDTLVDATQVCSHYCSVGRFLKTWELYSLLAFFWDLELTLEDLGLAPQTRAEALAVLTAPAPDPREAKRLRAVLAGAYSNRAGNTFRGLARLAGDSAPGKPVVAYPDGSRLTGDFRRGADLWRLSCAHCHEPRERPLTREKAERFSKDAEEYHAMIAEGTRHSFKRYMPNFTLERLSRRQSADILAFLQQFAATGLRP